MWHYQVTVYHLFFVQAPVCSPDCFQAQTVKTSLVTLLLEGHLLLQLLDLRLQLLSPGTNPIHFLPGLCQLGQREKCYLSCKLCTHTYKSQYIYPEIFFTFMRDIFFQTKNILPVLVFCQFLSIFARSPGLIQTLILSCIMNLFNNSESNLKISESILFVHARQSYSAFCNYIQTHNIK